MLKYFNFPYDFQIENFVTELFLHEKFKPFENHKVHFYGCYPKWKTYYKSYVYFRSRRSNEFMSKWLAHGYGVPDNIDDSAFNIWITFENRRPLIEKFDLTISFDLDEYGGRNFYFPLLYFYTSLSSNPKLAWKHLVSQDELTNRREISDININKKIKTVALFMNNPHPVRMNAFQLLRNYVDVEGYGRFFNKYAENKIEVLEKYWMNLCFENDLYPGYVTEKILESWLAFSVPLYWGWDYSGILNKNAFLNLVDYSGIENFCADVNELSRNPTKMKQMISEPLLNKKVDLERFSNFIYTGLKKKFG